MRVLRLPGSLLWLSLFCLLGTRLALGQDTTPPTLVSASSVTGREIGICFSEEMDRPSLEQAVNFLVEDGTGIKGVLEAIAQPGNLGVLLKLAEPVSGDFVVTVGFVFDVAGNLLEPGSTVTGRVWQAALDVANIGNLMPTGTVFSCVEGQLSLRADGEFINERQDRSTLLYVRRSNDFDVCVRLEGLREVASPYGGAGLIARESLQPGSIHQMVLATAINGVNRVYSIARGLPDQLAGHIEPGPKVDSFPLWLRLRRAGQFLTGYVSHDGLAWTQVGSTFNLPSLPPQTFVGVTVASAASGSAVSGTFREFRDTVLYPNVSLALVEAPRDLTVEAHQMATFRARAQVTGAPLEAVRYQWQAESAPGTDVYTNIISANAATYTTPFLSENQSGIRFRVVLSVNGNPPLLSPPALLTVGPDVTGPRVLDAVGTRRLREILLTFSEPLERVGAATVQNYNVAGLTVANVQVDPSGSLVLLGLASVQLPGTSNVVEISHLTDVAGHPLVSEPSTIIAPALSLAPGYVLQERYFSIPGNLVNHLRFSPFYPNFPNEYLYVNQLEGPNDFLWECGVRLSGFIVPPVTGNYHFWICSDDAGEFRISLGPDPSRLGLVCWEPERNLYRDYLGTERRTPGAPENRSQTLFPSGIALEAGKPHYFEVLSKNSVFNGHLSVTWQVPGEPAPTNGAAPIPGKYLAGLVDLGRAQLSLLQDPVEMIYSFDHLPDNSHVLLSEFFDASDGAFTPALTGDPSGGWVYNSDLGAWTVDGSGVFSVPSDKTLTSRLLTVTRAGHVQLNFNHRYSFEYDGSLAWDGGQVRVSTNGSAFLVVPTSGFISNGYTRVVSGISGALGQEAFNGESPGYLQAQNISSSADLGYFKAGETIRIQFFGGWDELSTGTMPNWFIDRVEVVEGLAGGPAAMVSVAATGRLDFAPNQPVAYQWQRDCGEGFSDVPGAVAATYQFFPQPTDANCRFRCLIGLPGITLTSESAALAVPAPILFVTRENGQTTLRWTQAGHLEQAPSPSGAWSPVNGATNNAYPLPFTGDQTFYRVRVP